MRPHWNSIKSILIRCHTVVNSPYIPLLAFCAIATIVFIVLSFFRSMSAVENTLFQVLISGTGLLGSYIFGKNSARSGALEVVKPHARAAFRRVFALYNSLYRLSSTIEDLKQEGPDYRLNMIQILVHEHIATGQDAIEDWRDLVPEEVEEIEGIYYRRRASND